MCLAVNDFGTNRAIRALEAFVLVFVPLALIRSLTHGQKDSVVNLFCGNTTGLSYRENLNHLEN